MRLQVMKTVERKGSAVSNNRPNKSPRARKRKPAEAVRPDRSIFISGIIDDEMVAKLTPQIIALRQASTDPITVLIDSDGGNTWAAEVICGLLKSPDHAGARCQIDTVVTGRARSAAAEVLAQGDFIAAYPHAHILFHGTRF